MLSFTEKNVVDLHRVSSPLTFATTVEENIQILSKTLVSTAA